MRFVPHALSIVVLVLSPAVRARCQVAELDRSSLGKVIAEAVTAAQTAPASDTAVLSIMVQAVGSQLALGDRASALNTTNAIRRLPGSLSAFRSASRKMVCHSLDYLDYEEAKSTALALATGNSEEDDWIRAHLAIRLYIRKASSSDSATRLRDALSVAASMTQPLPVTDFYLALASSKITDSAVAHRALVTADSARRTIGDAELRRSRAALISRQAARLKDTQLVSKLASEIPKPGPMSSPLPAEQRKDTIDHLMLRAAAARKKWDLGGMQSAINEIPDPLHLGHRALAWAALAGEEPNDLKRQALQYLGVALLMGDSTYVLRDELLMQFASEMLGRGLSLEAIFIAHEIKDPALAGQAIGGLGSPVAPFDAKGLRDLVDRVWPREVSDQVLLKVETMLLVKDATPQQSAWGLALVDSIRTPIVKAKAMIAAAEFLHGQYDEARSRSLFISAFRDGIDLMTDFERQTLLSRLAGLKADAELLAWARSQPTAIARARALLTVVEVTVPRLPKTERQSKAEWTYPDDCRVDFLRR